MVTPFASMEQNNNVEPPRLRGLLGKFWFLGLVLILCGPLWMMFDPGDLEIGEILYFGLSLLILPVLSLLLFVALLGLVLRVTYKPKTWSVYVMGVLVAGLSALVLASHRTLGHMAFKADIVIGPLRYWHVVVDAIAVVAWIIGLIWLFSKGQQSAIRALWGYTLITILMGICLPAGIGAYSQAISKSSPEWTAWRQGEASERICSNVLSRDRYDCYQKLASDTNTLDYCAQSRPDLSCARPFALKGDYSFCNNSMLVKDNPKGWHPEEVELASGGSEKYQKEFSLSSNDLIPVYCVAGLLHQQWAADCDWLPQQSASECRTQEVGLACNYLENHARPACLKALGGEGLFTQGWFDTNFHIWNNKAVNFYPSGTGATESLGYLRIPVGNATVSRAFDSDLPNNDVIVRRIFHVPGQSGRDGTVAGTFFGAASRTASMEAVEKAVYATNYELRQSPVLNDQSITLFGQQARMRTYSNADTYALRITFRVLTFRYKDANYAMLFDSSSTSIDWQNFLSHMSLQTIWQQ